MKLENGDIINQLGKFEVVLCTTNSHIKQNGNLIMDKGNAYALNLLTNKEFSLFAGLYLKKIFPQTWQFPKLMTYGCVIPWSYNGNNSIMYTGKNSLLGLFQTKYCFYNSSTVELVTRSTCMLTRLAEVYTSIACPFPGIGLGNLLSYQVMPIIEKLPDNVVFFKL